VTDGGSLAHVSDHRREHVLVERVDCKISFATSPDSDGAEPYAGADEAVRVEVRVVLVAVLECESDAVRPGPVVVHDDVLDRLAAVTLEVERRRALQRSLRARIALVLVGPLRDALGDDQVGRVHVAPPEDREVPRQSLADRFGGALPVDGRDEVALGGGHPRPDRRRRHRPAVHSRADRGVRRHRADVPLRQPHGERLL
jgi:hypothetical protein